MESLLDNLEERRNLFEEKLLTDTCYLLQRTLQNDGGGTRLEIFTYTGINFPCRLQQIQRRPEETTIGNAEITITDLVVIYRPDGIKNALGQSMRLNKVDRIQVGNSIYSLRDIYDNIPDQMTSRAYIGLLPDEIPEHTPPQV